MDNELNIIYRRGELVVLRVTVVGEGEISEVGLVWVKKIVDGKYLSCPYLALF